MDLTPTFDELDDIQAQLFPAVVEAKSPLPLLSQLPAVKDISEFLQVAHKRVVHGLDTIFQYPTDASLSVLRVGGPCSLNALLRLAEFYRRQLTGLGTPWETEDETQARAQPGLELVAKVEDVLAKEQRRRWATATFALGASKKVDRLRALWSIYMEGVMRAGITAAEVCLLFIIKVKSILIYNRAVV